MFSWVPLISILHLQNLVYPKNTILSRFKYQFVKIGLCGSAYINFKLTDLGTMLSSFPCQPSPPAVKIQCEFSLPRRGVAVGGID